ncbi:trypsin-like peptidase domain-containing protein [Cupriavidus sp. CV2]|uniref:trypsin-like peptidase domain-containing protein n=1 Tax=Cupriavidus ulmosensis TaxID=3065913 RepID=UPI00296B5615|nr:trypsin-like peptidase domain-containing protein [Cupriavidus sp. CV2]MDW3687710.1 trypsin-like peptidase domain-containing protein [Cupriavidus sp. CV2]
MRRIIITHLSGSKAHQIEQFEVARFDKLILGRDPTATVVFDPQRDDLVSRQHAAIQIKKDDPARYMLVDLGSSNGTYLNGRRVDDETLLEPGDTIELGEGGPRLAFDLEPRPVPAPAPTRLNAKALAETRVGPPTAVPASAVPATGRASAHTGAMQETRGGQPPADTVRAEPTPATDDRVGKETVLRMMNQERRSTGRRLIIGAGVAAVLAAIVVGAFAHFGILFGRSPEAIVAEFGEATVVVEARWHIVDKNTGRPIYQRICIVENLRLPCYLQIDNNPVQRWLTTDDDDHRGIPIEVGGRGSGFVVKDQGFILTNKHVAQGWKVPGWMDFDSNGGILIRISTGGQGEITMARINPKAYRQLKGWDFDHAVRLIRPNFAAPGGMALGTMSLALLEGRNESLSVRFPNTRDSIEARLVKASAEADVAEIKIDATRKLPTINLASVGTRPRVGERVTVLGYPGISEEKHALVQSSEGGNITNFVELIPQPTVTEGIIAKVGDTVKSEKNVQTYDDLGDVYQLTVTATGHGNSGGPVFDGDGKVIGLFTYSRSMGDERVTFAVPIKYGLDLLLN